MNAFEIAALEDAIAFADEAETYLHDDGVEGVTGLKAELMKVKTGALRFSEVANRDLSTVVDVVAFPAALITIFSIIGQIRAGHFMSGASREEIVAMIIDKALKAEGLSGAAKERVVVAALQRL